MTQGQPARSWRDWPPRDPQRFVDEITSKFDHAAKGEAYALIVNVANPNRPNPISGYVLVDHRPTKP
jgi:hypothetical protein